jgi:NADH dehydrogenase
MILIVGATGHLGSEICRRLVAQNKPVRGLIRPSADANKRKALEELGVELANGDLKDRASLEAACKGVDTIITTATCVISRQPDDSIEATDRDGYLNLIEAAKAAGVRHFVYTSYSGGIDRGATPCPLTLAKRTVEHALKESGISYTILRPSYFMEVWLSPMLGFDAANAKATIYGAGRNPISWIARTDVAAFAVASLDNPAALNAVLELGGPQALSPLEVVKVFEEAGGRPMQVDFVPLEALESQRASATDSLAQSFAGLMLGYAAGDPIEMAEMLRRVPVPLTPLKAYAEQTMQAQALA